MTSECLSILAQLRPRYVHIEYLQPLEVALSLPAGRCSATFHDIGSSVSRQQIRASVGPIQTTYKVLEHARVTRLERRATRQLGRIACLSQRDADILKAGGHRATYVPLGVSESQFRWDPSTLTRAPSLVFAGALWRFENVATARWLIREVMPRLNGSASNATLRLVGSGAPESLLRLASASEHTKHLGRVSSFEKEYAQASLVLAPSMVDAGVLLKALKAMTIGAPVVFNSRSAIPIGINSGETGYIADDPGEFAGIVADALADRGRTERIAAAGQALARSEFSWSRYAEILKGVIECE